MIFFIFLILIILLLVIVFAVQNSAVIVVHFLSWQFSWSASLLVLLSFFLGVLIGVLLLFPSLLKKSWRLRKTSRELGKINKGQDRARDENQVGSPDNLESK